MYKDKRKDRAKTLRETDPEGYVRYKEAQRRATKKYREKMKKENPELFKAMKKKHRDQSNSNFSYIEQAYKSAKSRAKYNGLDFNIELEDVIVPDFCPVLGIPLTKNKGNVKENSPSIDRRDNSKGYVKGNISVISYKANRYKSDMSINDVENLLRYMKELPTEYTT